jgi:hypothetical protein
MIEIKKWFVQQEEEKNAVKDAFIQSEHPGMNDWYQQTSMA